MDGWMDGWIDMYVGRQAGRQTEMGRKKERHKCLVKTCLSL